MDQVYKPLNFHHLIIEEFILIRNEVPNCTVGAACSLAASVIILVLLHNSYILGLIKIIGSKNWSFNFPKFSESFICSWPNCKWTSSWTKSNTLSMLSLSTSRRRLFRLRWFYHFNCLGLNRYVSKLLNLRVSLPMLISISF